VSKPADDPKAAPAAQPPSPEQGDHAQAVRHFREMAAQVDAYFDAKTAGVPQASGPERTGSMASDGADNARGHVVAAAPEPAEHETGPVDKVQLPQRDRSGVVLRDRAVVLAAGPTNRNLPTAKALSRELEQVLAGLRPKPPADTSGARRLGRIAAIGVAVAAVLAAGWWIWRARATDRERAAASATPTSAGAAAAPAVSTAAASTDTPTESIAAGAPSSAAPDTRPASTASSYPAAPPHVVAGQPATGLPPAPTAKTTPAGGAPTAPIAAPTTSRPRPLFEKEDK
jgi:hypothetical protein